MDPVKLAASWMVTLGIGMATIGGGVVVLALELMVTQPTIWQVEFELVHASTAQRIFMFGLFALGLGLAATLLGTFLFLREEWLVGPSP